MLLGNGMSGPEVQYWIFLLLFAVAIDLVIGGPRILGRIPGPDSLLRLLWGAAFGLHDAEESAPRNQGLFVGALATVVLLLLAISVGWYIDHAPDSLEWVFFAKALLLALIIGQQNVIRTGFSLARHLDQHSSVGAEGRHAAARWTIERVTHRYSDGFVGNVLLLIVFGFTGLLGYRVLSVVTAIGSPNGIMRPQAGLYRPAAVVSDAVSLIPGALAALMLALAMVVTSPSRLAMATRGLVSKPLRGTLLSRQLPIATLCYGLGVSLKADPNMSKDKIRWIGPEEARARARAHDIRATIITVLAAELMIIGIIVAITLLYADSFSLTFLGNK